MAVIQNASTLFHVAETAKQMHDRLRDELVSLEGQIKHQTRLNTSNRSMKPGAAR
jgi:hypothetical protein